MSSPRTSPVVLCRAMTSYWIMRGSTVHRLSRDLHLQDGAGRDGGGRRPAARSWTRRIARHRRLGNADRHLDQHQRPDDHDRRKGRRFDFGRRSAETGGVVFNRRSRRSGNLGRARSPLGPRFRGGDEKGVGMQADYVIVGAGSAGCVLANRLTEDPATRVVLIEAGGRDWNPLIHIPAGFMKLLDHPSLTWGFKAEADPGTNGRAIPYPRGRVLGGSSSINGLIYIRGQPEDFDHWAQLGNRGWGWDDVLPYFKKAENWQGEASEPHGSGGFLTTSPMSERPAACRAIIAAAQELGLEYRADVNNLPPGAGNSIGWCQQTRSGRRRASAARTYLRPASKRPNLQVITGALVHRVVFDGTRAIGVEFSRNRGAGNAIERVDAACEVMLAAGPVGSPHLLQLSGVGDPEVLAKAGIPVHHELPGVGRNFQDHYIARMSCEVTGIETLNERGLGLSFASEVLRYFTSGTGMLTYSASLCAASVKVLEESATPDVQCVFAPASYKPGLIRVLDDKPGITGGPWQMRPLSRGYVLVRSPDPREQPAINPRYLAEDTDRRAMVGGLRFLRRLFACGPYLAATCWCVRPIRASSRRSTRVIWPRTPTGARWSVVSDSCVGCSHAAPISRLRAGAFARSARAAGDQPALSGRGHRPARDGRWSQIPASAVRGTVLGETHRRREDSGTGCAERRRAPGLRAAEWLNRLSRELQLHDGRPRDERR